MTVGLAASIHARLLNRAKARGEDFNLILTRYAAKRAQWKAFLGKNRLDAPTLEEVIEEVRNFVAEPLALARQRRGTP